MSRSFVGLVSINYKEFELVTRDDIISYLNSLRKLESVDPTHKWIGTSML
jgi:hypothetical protein